MSKLMLVDTNLAGDWRVLDALNELGPATHVVDIRDRGVSLFSSLRAASRALLEVLRCLAGLRISMVTRSRMLAASSGHSLFAGLPACFRWLFRSVRAVGATHDIGVRGLRVVYAHDLYAATAAVMIKRSSALQLIYDVHELQIHRARHTGALRILLEQALEKRILTAATEVRVVNRPIADMMLQWYSIPCDRIRIRTNDHFTHHAPAIPRARGRPAILYVGKGVVGRQLSVIDQAPDALGFDVYMYLLGSQLPRSLSGRHWNFGPEDYEPHLLARARSTRSLMWCCVDSTHLSYRYATPNKFFQALAVGIPVIATHNTYLADIVSEYGIGAVFDGTNLKNIAEKANSSAFVEWTSAVIAFRSQLRSGAQVI